MCVFGCGEICINASFLGGFTTIFSEDFGWSLQASVKIKCYLCYKYLPH